MHARGVGSLRLPALAMRRLVNGTAVNPVEWWDMKWMQDRVFRKIMEAGGSVT